MTSRFRLTTLALTSYMKRSQPKSSNVSVAMATYNGEEFLEEQLESIAEQTQQPAELVVADDASTDATVAILREFKAKVPFPVRILEGATRLNYRLNFRRATQDCSSPIIAFCDQDDVWRRDKLERMSRAFDDPSVLLAYHNATVSSASGARMLHSVDQELAGLCEQSLAPFKSPNGLLMLFRAELRRFDDLWDTTIDQNEGDVILAHDQWYFFLARALGRVCFIDEPLVLYRQHGRNTLGTPTRFGFRERIARRLIHFGAADEWAAQSALSRSNVLRAIGDREHLDRLRAIAELYEDLALKLKRRASIYCRESAPARATALLHCLAADDYRGGAWAFQRLSLIRDLWSGVVRAKCTDPTRTS